MQKAIKSRWIRWAQLFVLLVSAESIYYMTYIQYSFYIPLQEALGISNTQMGLFGTVYGIGAMILYIPGGWLADRFSVRKLLAVSGILTGALGWYMSTFPSYAMIMLIYILWTVSSILTFWAALLKATRLWGSSRNQGKAFGFLEGGRGIYVAILTALMIALFSNLGSDRGALAAVMRVVSSICILVGIVAWFVFEDKVECDAGEKAISVEDYKKAFKSYKTWLPTTLLVGVIIVCIYAFHAGTNSYLSPFATQVYGASVTFGLVISMLRNWVRPFTAIISGFLADKVSTSKVIIVGCIFLLLSLIVLVVVPGSPSLIPVLIATVIVMSLANYSICAVYFALLEEGNIPVAVTGTAIGILSVIAYSPDFILPLITGPLLDNYPAATAYKIFFTLLTVLVAIALVVTIIFRKRTAAKRIEMYQKEPED